jgi:glycosyltransferase involved in cell wall biosynthesis
LTLDEEHFAGLCEYIEKIEQRFRLIVRNAGGLSHDSVLALYKKSRAVIYPSKFESFGLPLIEARQAGLPVLASELDYVRDVLDPEQVFDPNSPMSIARAVKRFMGVEENSLVLLNATMFLDSVLERGSE